MWPPRARRLRRQSLSKRRRRGRRSARLPARAPLKRRRRRARVFPRRRRRPARSGWRCVANQRAAPKSRRGRRRARPSPPSNGRHCRRRRRAGWRSLRGPRPPRERRGAPRAVRARLMGRPRGDRRRAARIFMGPAMGRRTAALRQIVGALAKACGRIEASVARAIPISASARRPLRSRPGSSKWPGFSPKKGDACRRLDRRCPAPRRWRRRRPRSRSTAEGRAGPRG